MAQSLCQIFVHLVYSTKDRRPLIKYEDRISLHGYSDGILKNLGCHPIEINSVRNHIHLLFTQSRNHAPAKVVEQLKSASSKWLKEKGAMYRDFGWQKGYGEFSVSATHVDSVVAYVRAQEEHHKKEDFKTEFRRFCEKNGMPVDERYVWD